MKFLYVSLCLVFFFGFGSTKNVLDESSYLINELSTLESNLQQAQNLVDLISVQHEKEVLTRDEPSSNILGQFVKSISHEINNMRGLVNSMNDQFLKTIRANRREQNKANLIRNVRARRSVIDQNERQATVIANNLVNTFSEGLQNSLSALNNLMVNINRSVNNIVTRVSTQITNSVVAVNNAAQSGVASLNSATQSGINAVGTITQSGFNTVTGAAQAGINAVGSAAQAGINVVGSAVQTGYNSISNVASSTVNTATNTVNRLTG